MKDTSANKIAIGMSAYYALLARLPYAEMPKVLYVEPKGKGKNKIPRSFGHKTMAIKRAAVKRRNIAKHKRG